MRSRWDSRLAPLSSGLTGPEAQEQWKIPSLYDFMIASSPRLRLPGWKAQIKHTPGRSVSDFPVGLHIKLLSSDWAQITLIPVLRGNSTAGAEPGLAPFVVKALDRSGAIAVCLNARITLQHPNHPEIAEKLKSGTLMPVFQGEIFREWPREVQLYLFLCIRMSRLDLKSGFGAQVPATS